MPDSGFRISTVVKKIIYKNFIFWYGILLASRQIVGGCGRFCGMQVQRSAQLRVARRQGLHAAARRGVRAAGKFPSFSKMF
jgi:hypothetical protein